MRIPLRAWLVIPLLAAAAWTGALSDELRATPRPPPGPAAALGGFSAIGVQILWMRGDAALRANRLPEALYYFRAIESLEPQLVAASSYFADEVGRNMADLEPDDDVRASLGMLAVEILDRAIEQNPDLAAAHTARGTFLGTRVALDATQARRFYEERGRTPFAAARDDLRRATELGPRSIEARLALFQAAFQRAAELFVVAFTDGDAEAAASAADGFMEAAAAAREVARLQTESYGTDPDVERDAVERVASCRRFVDVIRAAPETRVELYQRLFDDFGERLGLPGPR